MGGYRNRGRTVGNVVFLSGGGARNAMNIIWRDLPDPRSICALVKSLIKQLA